MRIEQIKKFGPTTLKWLLELYNNCLRQNRIPKIWRKTKIIAILKPGKEPSNPQNYRPISLLCHLYKIFERLLLNRLSPKIDSLLIPEQACFRPQRNCTAQVIHLTQHIEDGFEKGKITATAFIDLSSAYDTVQHRIMLHKIYELTKDYGFTRIIATLLHNRRFYVEFQGRHSRWRNQRNGLPQGSVLSPTLFNIYTNDQPRPSTCKSFIYADDLALTVQTVDFEEAEQVLTTALGTLSDYYKKNHLKPNPQKTQVCAFHLRNRQAGRKLKVSWEGTELEHCFTPKYLGVTLDRSLTYRQHCLNTKQKVAARNNIIRKLIGNDWGAQPQVVRTSAMALCFSAGEYACPVWQKSTHAKQVDVALNETARLITGCLKPTPTDKLYYLAGIAPPEIRRQVAANDERKKVEENELHPLHGHTPPRSRLKSRNSFLRSTSPLKTTANKAREELWAAKIGHLPSGVTPAECLPAGHNLDWTTWKSLNRLRAGVGKTKDNLAKWGYLQEPPLCECGEVQTTKHLWQCSCCPVSCSEEELFKAKENGIAVARFWAKTV